MRKVLIAVISVVFLSSAALSEEQRSPQEIKLTYTAYWGGFVISKVYSTTVIDSTDYSVDVSYEVTGLASIFSNMKNNTSVRGKIAPDGSLKPLVYENRGSWSSSRFRNRTAFQEIDSKIISHDYEFKFKKDAKYIPIKDDLKYGPDLLSFYLGLTFDDKVMSVGSEMRHQNVFGGFFLLDIAYRCPATKLLKSRRSLYQGDTLVCEFHDKVVGGGFERIKKKKKPRKKKLKKKKRKETMEPTPLQIRYARVGDLKAMIPVYTEFSIGWGKVRVYLSDIKVTPIQASE